MKGSKKVYSRQYSIKLDEHLSGGPKDYPDELTNDIAKKREAALLHATKAVKRFVTAHDSKAVDRIYFDGIQVRDGLAYVVVKITFSLAPIPKLSIVKFPQGVIP